MKNVYYQTIPDAEQQDYNPTLFGELDRKFPIIPHHIIPIYPLNHSVSQLKQTLPQIKRTHSLQIKPREKNTDPIKVSYRMGHGKSQPLVISPVPTLPAMVAPMITTPRASPAYAALPPIRPTFNYVQPYQNKLAFPVTNKINYKIIKKF
ncbi:hypothetical protein BpHYR1_002918 [Brachionus plicatilis]|uniref:Uncharacterized protein n=1 Tax=Brachionus plicatilis TaxID=10195 RepID=A0A3M7P2X2_BRAPC|nr:hypothetical protein BpHYR1_002918 [Brachionus plicatilis]